MFAALCPMPTRCQESTMKNCALTRWNTLVLWKTCVYVEQDMHIECHMNALWKGIVCQCDSLIFMKWWTIYVVVNRYKVICPDTWPSFKCTARQACEKIINFYHLEQLVSYGKTLIFIRTPKTLYYFEELREAKIIKYIVSFLYMYLICWGCTLLMGLFIVVRVNIIVVCLS